MKWSFSMSCISVDCCIRSWKAQRCCVSAGHLSSEDSDAQSRPCAPRGALGTRGRAAAPCPGRRSPRRRARARAQQGGEEAEEARHRQISIRARHQGARPRGGLQRGLRGAEEAAAHDPPQQEAEQDRDPAAGALLHLLSQPRAECVSGWRRGWGRMWPALQLSGSGSNRILIQDAVWGYSYICKHYMHRAALCTMGLLWGNHIDFPPWFKGELTQKWKCTHHLLTTMPMKGWVNFWSFRGKQHFM